ncbi:uncharacterized protein LOC107026568 isoform X1 [Solanum pennellii]|uniref:Uncharacterized protein LOC107026568 isoform X1 n=1 Tax=Solanum pennellii TaxID=28526 RepID=A0ABM1VFD9_SOLPN|nr:uncharacterized protein LOC107026568 isoform X1 [Solanum pennellii]
MLPQRMKKVMTDNPKKLANLIDLVNLPSTLREFMGQSQTSRLGCFKRVWSYIKENNLQSEDMDIQHIKSIIEPGGCLKVIAKQNNIRLMGITVDATPICIGSEQQELG